MLRLLMTATIFFSLSSHASYKIQTTTIDNQKINITHWHNNQEIQGSAQTNKPTIVLLSGPIDSWNSDSAWFARLAPKIAKTHRVISIDRPGQITATSTNKVGYIEFGNLLKLIFEELKLEQVKLLTFSSSNISLFQYLSNNNQSVVKSAILIDPDVLLSYSIGRYSKDAKPFKDNLKDYLLYIDEGKYTQRAKQKNDIEMTMLKKLAENDQDTDWNYIRTIFKSRLHKNNLKNLFSEVAIYDQDLSLAKNLKIPSTLNITIIDTNFEQQYIDSSDNEKDKKNILKWKMEAIQYYKSLANNSDNGKYIQLTTQQHLLPFSEPDLIIRLLNELP